MSLVVDSSVAASWGIPDEDSATAKRALLRLGDAQGLAPNLFPYELLNVFLMNERRNRLSIEQVELGLDFVRDLELQIADDGLPSDIARLARRHNLTGYDATYLELALRTGSTLATLDRALAKAAIREGVEVISDRA